MNLPFPLIVLGAAVIGYFGGRFASQKFSVGGAYAVLPYVYQGAVGHYGCRQRSVQKLNGSRR